MIISKLLGGLGNQMFEYAIGKNLSIKYNTELKLDNRELLDRSHKNFIFRNYDLDIFKIDVEVGNFHSTNIIKEPYFHFNKNVLNILNGLSNLDIYLDGFWQSYKYFQDIEDIIRKDFEFKNEILEISKELMHMIENTDSVMINIRRTDYLNTNFHGVMGNEFIMKGIEIIKSKFENLHYFVFSDDIEWCVNNIHIDNLTIVDHSHKGYKFDNYLNLMIRCKHFIVPNSTFAWWAAWLNQNKNRMVIAPKKWFTNENINTNDLIPQDWIRI